MKKKGIYSFIVVFLISLGVTWFMMSTTLKKENQDLNHLKGTVIYRDDEEIKVQDQAGIIYTFSSSDMKVKVGDKVELQYKGSLDQNKSQQEVAVVKYQSTEEVELLLKEGLFSAYYTRSYQKLQTMMLDEKIAQLLLVRYPDNNQVEILKQYQFGGYLFFEKDFKNKTQQQVQEMMSSLQQASKIPILTAVDEEGGNVVRISRNAPPHKEKQNCCWELTTKKKQPN